jgi:hypothetical protein
MAVPPFGPLVLAFSHTGRSDAAKSAGPDHSRPGLVPRRQVRYLGGSRDEADDDRGARDEVMASAPVVRLHHALRGRRPMAGGGHRMLQ